MAINFTTDILPFYASDVGTDAAYTALPANRRNSTAEQAILTSVEVLRALMAEFRSPDEARLALNVLARMLASMSMSSLYDVVSASVEGNTNGVKTVAATGDTVSVTTPTGTAAVVVANGPFATTAALAAEINAKLAANVPAIDEVEAYATVDGRLGIRNTTGNEGVSFTLAHGAGPSLLVKAGINPGVVYGPIEVVANAARDDALSNYARYGRPVGI